MVDGELDGPKLRRATVNLVQDGRPGLRDRNGPLGHLGCRSSTPVRHDLCICSSGIAGKTATQAVFRQYQIALCAGELCESRLAARMQSLRKHSRRFFERFAKTTLDEPRTEQRPGHCLTARATSAPMKGSILAG